MGQCTWNNFAASFRLSSFSRFWVEATCDCNAAMLNNTHAFSNVNDEMAKRRKKMSAINDKS